LRLHENLDGLNWLVPHLDGKPAGPKPQPRSWMEPAQVSARMFARSNLAASCGVPFDSKKRGPEERAAMLEKIGIRKFVYDWRAEHKAQWDGERDPLKRHKIGLLGWWIPTILNADAKAPLELFKRHGVKPQRWVGGGPIQVKDSAHQKARIVREVER
jgi:hypothetical protein